MGRSLEGYDPIPESHIRKQTSGTEWDTRVLPGDSLAANESFRGSLEPKSIPLESCLAIGMVGDCHDSRQFEFNQITWVVTD